MINLVLHPGEKVRVRLHEADGEFVIRYGPSSLTVTADLPGNKLGTAGLIYEEAFGGIDADSVSDDDNWAEGTIADGMRAYDRSRREP